ncbi:hypothetical protein BTUL_0058g00040 [Botrytis tulipae]|uniref:Uncharacterized protein n=1 Tax=Botrytis tulipae TaxID=87230 RepID=A0A4Z1ERH2_9HELO|nr:hypothetical protein BTUL_0058g00040 [Botrytis tulipae]
MYNKKQKSKRKFPSEQNSKSNLKPRSKSKVSRPIEIKNREEGEKKGIMQRFAMPLKNKKSNASLFKTIWYKTAQSSKY